MDSTSLDEKLFLCYTVSCRKNSRVTYIAPYPTGFLGPVFHVQKLFRESYSQVWYKHLASVVLPRLAVITVNRLDCPVMGTAFL